MRVFLIILLSAICPVAMQTPKQISKLPFELRLTTEKPTVEPTSKVFVKIHWTNTSNKVLNADAYIEKGSNLDLNYTLEFRDNEGRPVPKVPEKSPMGRMFDATFGALEPGKTITNEVNLRKIYDFSLPGRYVLQVSRRVPEELGGGVVKSNTITITVTAQN